MLLYDLTAAQGWGTTKQHGGGKYAEIIFEALCKARMPMVAMWDSRRWISENIEELCVKYHVDKVDCCNSTLEEVVHNNAVDKIYSALPQDEILSYRGCKIIATLHGLRIIEMPNEWIKLRYPMPFYKRVKHILKMILLNDYSRKKNMKFYGRFFSNEKVTIITVSNHTKYAISSFYPHVDVDRIRVYYSPSTSYPLQAKREPGNYFLVVSANREEKNALRAIMAFDNLLSNNKLKKYKMKLTGIDRNIFRYKIENPDYFEFCGYVSEEDLNNLYANAYALVYPSLTEGFGYPPLEAMRYGVPVLASSHTSISEVCGGAALYFNPFSVEEIMNRMLQMTDVDIYKHYEMLSHQRYSDVTLKQNEDLKALVEYIAKA